MIRLFVLLALSAAAVPAQVSPVGSHDRARNLALVTLDARDTSVEDVLELLRRQTGHDLATPGLQEETLSRKVSITADAEALTTVLHKIGVTPKVLRVPVEEPFRVGAILPVEYVVNVALRLPGARMQRNG